MIEINELERLRCKRAELEAESRTLKEKQKNMENRIIAIEEKIAIEELENKNKVTRSAIAQLESRIRNLENTLKYASQEPSGNPVPSTKTQTAESAEKSLRSFEKTS